MRPLNLQQYNKCYWYCTDTDTVYEKTETPYMFYRRERGVDLREGENTTMQFRDNVVGMDGNQLPVFGSNVNTYQPNYSDGSEKHRRHKRRRFRKTVPSAPRAIATQYLEPFTVDEYHQKYCVMDPVMNVWKYVAYERYSVDKSGNLSLLERLENDRKCVAYLRDSMARSSVLSSVRQRHGGGEKRGPRRRRQF